MALIPVSRGRGFAIVDDEDYADLSQYTWALAGTRGRYASRRVLLPNGKSSTLYMHRHIMQPPDGVQVDHVNRNPLDNRRANLRLCTQSQNNANTPSWKRSASGFRGVSLDSWSKAKTKRWRADVYQNNKRVNIGYFSTPQEAAHAYDAAARELFGEFAILNFPNVR